MLCLREEALFRISQLHKRYLFVFRDFPDCLFNSAIIRAMQAVSEQSVWGYWVHDSLCDSITCALSASLLSFHLFILSFFLNFFFSFLICIFFSLLLSRSLVYLLPFSSCFRSGSCTHWNTVGAALWGYFQGSIKMGNRVARLCSRYGPRAPML